MKTSYFYKYKVEFYENDEEIIETGLVFKSSLKAAIKAIVAEYGDDAIDHLELTCMGETTGCVSFKEISEYDEVKAIV